MENMGLKPRYIFSLLLAFAISLIGIFHASLFPLNHDAGFFLHVAERMRLGEAPYRDIMLSNTPFIIYYSRLAVELAHLFSLPIDKAFLLFAFMLLFLCTALALRIFSYHPSVRSQRKLLPLFSIALPILLYIFPSIAGGNAFGQREHVFFALFLPYVITTWLLLRLAALPISLRCLAAVSAALGLIIKPHFLVLFLTSEAYLLYRLRNWRIGLRQECLLILAIWLTAHIAAFFLYPDYFTSLPHLRALYAGHMMPLATFTPLAFSMALMELFGMALLLMLVYRAQIESCIETLYIALLALGSFAVFFLHHAGFNYQLLPMRLFFVLLCIHTLIHLPLYHQRQPYFLAFAFATWLFLMQPLSALEKLPEHYAQHKLDLATHKELEQRFSGKTVMLLSPSMWPGYPTINYTNMRDVSYLTILLYLPAFYQNAQPTATEASYHSPSTMPSQERYFFNHTVEDMIRKTPDILLVDIGKDKQGLENITFDILTYLSQDKRFAQQLSHYTKVESPIPNLAFYQKYSASK